MHSENSHILSAMPPAGRLHIGHYWGALISWKKLQYEYNCFFMLADVHHLINNIHDNTEFTNIVHETIIDWLAVGIDPSQAVIFIQSHIPEHFELNSLLAAITPLSWLERVPYYKEVQEQITGSDLNSYGLLGAPLLQSADILTYSAKYVIASEEQTANIELTREIARRFNYLFGREEGFGAKALATIKKLGHKKALLYENLLMRFQQQGDDAALEKAQFLLKDAINLSHGERECLAAFLENKGKIYLPEPQLFPEKPQRIIGTDGKYMCIRNHNTIDLRETIDNISHKIRNMMTDPARIRRSDPGNPNACPVWKLHQLYSNKEVSDWVSNGCQFAQIGCLDCKQPLIEAINQQQLELNAKAKPYQEDPALIKRIISDGCARAREVANSNLKLIKQAMGLAP